MPDSIFNFHTNPSRIPPSLTPLANLLHDLHSGTATGRHRGSNRQNQPNESVQQGTRTTTTQWSPSGLEVGSPGQVSTGVDWVT